MREFHSHSIYYLKDIIDCCKMTAKIWKLVKRFDGTPKVSDLNLVEEALPAVSDNGWVDIQFNQ